MSDLEKYVDKLFSAYQKDKKAMELKQEILSNLEARKADLIEKGLDNAAAMEQIKMSIPEIDSLIDWNQKIYIRQFYLAAKQTCLLYLTIVWLITIPMILFRPFALLNMLFLLSVIASGAVYLIDLRSVQKQTGILDQTGYINLKVYAGRRRLSFIIWLLFVIVCTLVTTGINFSSNIWFSRPVQLNGPYQFALLVSSYAAPFFTGIIPLFISRMIGLTKEYEVQDDE